MSVRAVWWRARERTVLVLSETERYLASMVPRFQVLDLLVVVTAIAVTLAMWGRIPEYEDWHWNHALLT